MEVNPPPPPPPPRQWSADEQNHVGRSKSDERTYRTHSFSSIFAKTKQQLELRRRFLCRVGIPNEQEVYSVDDPQKKVNFTTTIAYFAVSGDIPQHAIVADELETMEVTDTFDKGISAVADDVVAAAHKDPYFSQLSLQPDELITPLTTGESSPNVSDDDQQQQPAPPPPPSKRQKPKNNFPSNTSMSDVLAYLIDSSMLSIEKDPAQNQRGRLEESSWEGCCELLFFSVRVDLSRVQLEGEISEKLKGFAQIKMKKFRTLYFQGRYSALVTFAGEKNAFTVYSNYRRSQAQFREVLGDSLEVYKVEENRLDDVLIKSSIPGWIPTILRNLPIHFDKQLVQRLLGSQPFKHIEEPILLNEKKHTMVTWHDLETAVKAMTVLPMKLKEIRHFKIHLHPRYSKQAWKSKDIAENPFAAFYVNPDRPWQEDEGEEFVVAAAAVNPLQSKKPKQLKTSLQLRLRESFMEDVRMLSRQAKESIKDSHYQPRSSQRSTTPIDYREKYEQEALHQLNEQYLEAEQQQPQNIPHSREEFNNRCEEEGEQCKVAGEYIQPIDIKQTDKINQQEFVEETHQQQQQLQTSAFANEINSEQTSSSSKEINLPQFIQVEEAQSAENMCKGRQNHLREFETKERTSSSKHKSRSNSRSSSYRKSEQQSHVARQQQQQQQVPASEIPEERPLQHHQRPLREAFKQEERRRREGSGGGANDDSSSQSSKKQSSSGSKNRHSMSIDSQQRQRPRPQQPNRQSRRSLSPHSRSPHSRHRSEFKQQQNNRQRASPSPNRPLRRGVQPVLRQQSPTLKSSYQAKSSYAAAASATSSAPRKESSGLRDNNISNHHHQERVMQSNNVHHHYNRHHHQQQRESRSPSESRGSKQWKRDQVERQQQRRNDNYRRSNSSQRSEQKTHQQQQQQHVQRNDGGTAAAVNFHQRHHSTFNEGRHLPFQEKRNRFSETLSLAPASASSSQQARRQRRSVSRSPSSPPPPRRGNSDSSSPRNRRNTQRKGGIQHSNEPPSVPVPVQSSSKIRSSRFSNSSQSMLNGYNKDDNSQRNEYQNQGRNWNGNIGGSNNSRRKGDRSRSRSHK